jgi:hypothetical protein
MAECRCIRSGREDAGQVPHVDVLA